MTRDEFIKRLVEMGFALDPNSFAWRRSEDGAAMTVEFIDDFLAVWGSRLAKAALVLWAGGAKTLKVVSAEEDGVIVGRLVVVE